MKENRMRKKPVFALVLALALLAAALIWALATARTARLSYAAVQLDAAQRMQACMEAVKAEKLRLGIPLSPEDIHQTGMLGEEFNWITTTVGSLEAKRTTANPDMAALMVRMFHEAGLASGDRVGAGFSGSFPALNIAVLSACDAMGLQVVYIASVGASMYGANNPGFTFPEMACFLYDAGLTGAPPALVTLGGDGDVGIGMDAGMLADIRERLEKLPVPLMVEPDYQKNLEKRRALYEENGIGLFVSAGGNVTSLGLGEEGDALGQGLLRPLAWGSIRPGSGLVERYRLEGIPVINLLNIKKIVADYGMPYDPQTLPAPGESPVYFTRWYDPLPAAAGLLLSLACLAWYRRLIGLRE